ncbi:MAG: hypothetical protein A2122_01350 [Candidatus Liptonbacteria bacterium GWB1_49_6]|uniref:Uncharacterized protein n=1 Tax=Candidatus Liptonbacteria bacterium GWB1_49_6 TaxID=1798644 RepID=A0A1G2C6W7_9BACT|nr:MAG: hypothetical protein A2122_01350 [Candidatus Liptonbacteria bacterium GWB1_49_6]
MFYDEIHNFYIANLWRVVTREIFRRLARETSTDRRKRNVEEVLYAGFPAFPPILARFFIAGRSK